MAKECKWIVIFIDSILELFIIKIIRLKNSISLNSTNATININCCCRSSIRSIRKKTTSKDPTKPLGRKPYPRDENGKIIRPANKTTAQTAQTN